MLRKLNQLNTIFILLIIVQLLVISCSNKESIQDDNINKGFIKEVIFNTNGNFKEKNIYSYDDKQRLSRIDYQFNSLKNYIINVNWQADRIIKMSQDQYFQIFNYKSAGRLEWITSINWPSPENGIFQVDGDFYNIKVIRQDDNPLYQERNYFIEDLNLKRITFIHKNGESGETFISPSNVLRPNFFSHDFNNKNDSFNQFLNLSINCPSEIIHQYSDGKKLKINYTYETNNDNYPVKIIANYDNGVIETTSITYIQ